MDTFVSEVFFLRIILSWVNHYGTNFLELTSQLKVIGNELEKSQYNLNINLNF